MEKYNWGLIFSSLLAFISGVSAVCGDTLGAIYTAVTACYFWMVFDD